MFSNRTFGVEIELHLPENRTRRGLAGALNRAGILAVQELYNHSTRDHWKLVDDGSLGANRNRHVEVVSPILSGESGLAQVATVLRVAREFGCFVSTRCGLHVHVYAGDLSVKQMRAMATNFVHSETAFDCIMPPSRRGDSNQFVLSNRTAFGGAYESESINRAIDAYAAATDMESLIRTVAASGRGYNPWNSRYRKLNFEAFNRYKTVEFRQHAGTVEEDKALNWIRLCVAFVEKSMKSTPRKRTAMKAHKATDELNMLLKWLELGAEANKFFRARRKMFEEKALEAARRAGQPIPA